MSRVIALVLVAMLVLAGGVGYYAGTRHALAPAYVMASAECATFPQTGKTVCGRFLEYWQQNGALAQQGLPLSDEFREVSSVNQQTYTVQYFERAVFEMHPENVRPYDVLLTLLGREKFLAKYPGGNTSAPPSLTPPPSAAPSSPPPTGIIGQVFDFPAAFNKSNFRGTVTDLKDNVTLTDNGQTLKPNGKFVAVFIECANISDVPAEVGSLGFYLVDGRNRQFSLAGFTPNYSAKTQYGKPILYTKVQPGLSVEHVFVFDVAPDAGNYRMVPGK